MKRTISLSRLVWIGSVLRPVNLLFDWLAYIVVRPEVSVRLLLMYSKTELRYTFVFVPLCGHHWFRFLLGDPHVEIKEIESV